MARPGRLVNCSLVFLLVIRCTRAPGQKAGFRASVEPRTESGQARTTSPCSRDNCRIGIAAVIYVPYQNRYSGTATCNAPCAPRSCACAFYGRFERTEPPVISSSRGSIDADVLTEPAIGKRRQHGRGIEASRAINPSVPY